MVRVDSDYYKTRICALSWSIAKIITLCLYCEKKKEELTLKYREMYWLMGRYSALSVYNKLILYQPVLVGPCHHGMARPQVADRGTASDKEGSCE